MPMHRTSHQSAFSIVEALFASSLLIIIVTVFVGAVIYGKQSTALAGERQRAAFLAEEAIEVVRNMRDQDFSALTDGTYGLALVNNQWVFSGTSDTTGIFTRTVTLAAIGAREKQITSRVTWQQNAQRTGLIQTEEYIGNWRLDTTVQAQITTLNTGDAAIGGNGKSELQNLSIRNNSTTSNIIIDKIRISWTDANQNLKEIWMDGSLHWSGSEPTGTQIDISNVTITPNSTITFTPVIFSGNMNGNNFTVTFWFSDASSLTVSNITPP